MDDFRIENRYYNKKFINYRRIGDCISEIIDFIETIRDSNIIYSITTIN